jgi:hypothetical protein
VLTLAIVISLARPSKNVKTIYHADAVDIKSTRYVMNIPYDMVSQLELMELPDLGENIDGYSNGVIQTGLWRNDIWGEYQSCLDLACDTCIAVHMNDGRIFVISLRNPQENAQSYEEFLSRIQ